MTVSLSPRTVATLRSASLQLATLLKALAHPDRLLLLCQLAEGEYSVQALGARIGLRQPSLSQHLAVLRAEAIVTTRRAGRHIYYRLADDDIRQIMKVLSMLHRVTAGTPPCPPRRPTPELRYGEARARALARPSLRKRD